MLRPYQARSADEVCAALDAGEAPLLVSATGTGKTRTLIEVVLRHVDAGLVLWAAPSLALLEQASAAIRAAALVPEMDVIVRSNQELARPGATLPPVVLVVVDEAHHLGAPEFARVKALANGAPFVGGTATPERGDGIGLHGVFDRIVVGLDTREAIAQGYLVPADIIRPPHALGPGELAQDPVEAILAHAQGLKTITFHPSVEVAIQTATELEARGLRARALWGEMPARARKDVVDAFASGRLDVLTSVNALTEGFDVPDVGCVVLARGFGSHAGYIQAVGRGLRPAPGKTKCLVIDLRGCSHTHGDPDEPRTFHLEGKGIRRPGEGADVRWCIVCGAPTTAAACEQCGHAGEMRKRKPRVLGLPLMRFARKREEAAPERARTLARWLREARSKGWKPGHAMHRYRAVYGAMPSPEVVRLAKEAS